MAVKVIMPALGVAQQTGTLLKWLKTEGQKVSKGEPLMEIETDKATVEIEAPASGVLSQVRAKAGDEIPVGHRIALILAPGESARSLPESPHPDRRQDAEGTEARAGPAPAKSRPPLPTAEGRGEGEIRATLSESSKLNPAPESTSGRILASPAARRIAREQGIDLASLQGSGPEGSVLSRDVLAQTQHAPLQAGPTLTDTIQPLSPVRRIIAERMARSKQTAPHFYLSIDIDMATVIKRRADWNANAEARKPSHNDYILYTCARALAQFPALNSSFTEQGIRFHRDINVGMAVALDDGLVVPVIRYADRLSLLELALQSRELIAKAQSKKLLPIDYEGGTFTVSNLGMLGVDHFVAIINPPQAAILAIGRIAERVVSDNGMFAIRSLMTVTLSADHRAVDGAMGARFLQRIKQGLEKGEF
jgi:pyruvate dehydrogenase E2 component (dihydrolipoamide acetyltransferase)